MKQLTFGIYGAGINAIPAKQVLRELTICWSRYSYQDEILEADTLDELLKKAADNNFLYCFVQKAGHVIDEQWYPPAWHKTRFYKNLNSFLEGEDEFLFIGELNNDKLKKDCLLINVNLYKDLGRPPVNGFIKISEINGYKIKGFKKTMNEQRFDLTVKNENSFYRQLRQGPEKIIDAHGLTDSQTAFLKGVYSQTTNAQKGVFLFNIESYDDLDEGPGRVEAVFSVAAGFKANRILEVNGFDENTQVVFYDYSKKALEIKKQIVENWDGVNYPKFVKHIFDTNPTPDTFYQLWSGTTPENIDWDDVQWFWEYELKQWGGQGAFKEHWDQYKKLPHQYLHCNLLTEPDKILHEVAKFKKPYLWWSNAFFTVYSNWYFSTDERKKMYKKWITALAESNPDCRVNGSDFNNSSVNGLTAQEYLEAFRNSPPDELKPIHLYKTKIRY